MGKQDAVHAECLRMVCGAAVNFASLNWPRAHSARFSLCIEAKVENWCAHPDVLDDIEIEFVFLLPTIFRTRVVCVVSKLLELRANAQAKFHRSVLSIRLMGVVVAVVDPHCLRWRTA